MTRSRSGNATPNLVVAASVTILAPAEMAVALAQAAVDVVVAAAGLRLEPGWLFPASIL
jgi:hypothetical protein